MVRASHRSSEGCAFDLCLGLRTYFLRIELDERSSIVQDISKLPHFQNIYLNKNNKKIMLLRYQAHSMEILAGLPPLFLVLGNFHSCFYSTNRTFLDCLCTMIETSAMTLFQSKKCRVESLGVANGFQVIVGLEWYNHRTEARKIFSIYS